MKNLTALIRAEPTMVGSVVAALISIAASFGFNLTGTQVGAVMGAVSVMVGLVVRANVIPTVPSADPPKV